LHEVVTGHSAVRTGRMTDVLRRVASGTVDVSELTKQKIDPAFIHLLLGALRADPTTRYADAGVMREALEDWQASRQAERSSEDTDGAEHSTVSFLMRRMQRRKDFPALSQSLMEVNRLSAPDSAASATQLANVILRDYALTNKLLKLANSAFYGPYQGSVNNVSAAITVLGFEQVRLAANSLTYFGQLRDGTSNESIRDQLTASFMAGLVTRHLARQARLPDPEGAFIAGLFQRLGKTLASYYFPEDDDEIESTVRDRGVDEVTAARGVLGISYGELGVAVGRKWGFPDELLHCIRGLDPGEDVRARSPLDLLRDQAVFANSLCTLTLVVSPGEERSAVDALVERFTNSVPLDARASVTLLGQAAEKMGDFSDALSLDVGSSSILGATQTFLERVRADLGEDAPASVKAAVGAA
jgi:HD-like signal output (HDOD) protein